MRKLFLMMAAVVLAATPVVAQTSGLDSELDAKVQAALAQVRQATTAEALLTVCKAQTAELKKAALSKKNAPWDLLAGLAVAKECGDLFMLFVYSGDVK